VIKKYKMLWVAVAALALVETTVRVSGLTDFPVYYVDSEIGYMPKESQSGNFLRKNDWCFNDKSMPIALNWNPNLRPNVLLIGNSIVMGGDRYRQEDKLAPQIQKRLGNQPLIWPIAAGGWTQVNEMVYLNRHPEVVAQADSFAWEYMSGGLSAAKQWPGEYVFPSERPLFASWYVIRRYILPRFFAFKLSSELPVTGNANQDNIKKFDRSVAELVASSNRSRANLIWLYPNALQLREARQGHEWLPERLKLEEISRKHGVTVVDIAANPTWNSSLYRDDGVHLTVEGNSVLASILTEEFLKSRKRE
jgi:hypothetical protein